MSAEEREWNARFQELAPRLEGAHKFSQDRIDFYEHYLKGAAYLGRSPKMSLFLAGIESSLEWMSSGADTLPAIAVLKTDGVFLSFSRDDPMHLTRQANRILELQDAYRAHAAAMTASIETFSRAAQSIDQPKLRPEAIEKYESCMRPAATKLRQAADALTGIFESQLMLVEHWDAWRQPEPHGAPEFTDEAPPELTEHFQQAAQRYSREYFPSLRESEAALDEWQEWWTTAVRSDAPE